MSKIIHPKDNGLMEKDYESIKCIICGYYLKQSEITSAYINGKISLLHRWWLTQEYNFSLVKYENRRIIMFIDNLDKIIGMVGLIIGIELIAIAIFTVSILYFRSPVVAGIIGNLSSLGMMLGTIFVFVKKEMH